MVGPEIKVTSPYGRFQVAQGLADLADEAHQTAEWFHHGRAPADSFDAVIHLLYDDFAHFDDVTAVEGVVFSPGEEIVRAARLAGLLDEVLELFPGPDSRGLAELELWNRVRLAAASLLAEMVRNGGVDWPGEVTSR